MNSDTTAIIVVGLIVLVIWFFVRKGRAAKAVAFEEQRQEAFRESNRILKDLNKSFGAPEGTGPTGIMVDGEYRIVNIGHTERMKNDPTYAFGNKMAGIVMDMENLEGALKEAQAQSDTVLAQKIARQIQVLQLEADALLAGHKGDNPKSFR